MMEMVKTKMIRKKYHTNTNKKKDEMPTLILNGRDIQTKPHR
jgi:hypothetical protein